MGETFLILSMGKVLIDMAEAEGESTGVGYTPDTDASISSSAGMSSGPLNDSYIMPSECANRRSDP
jgi:hypothetical protein